MEQEFIEIQGTVEDVIFHNDESGFTVIELTTEDTKVEIPSEIKLIKEVTEAKEYKNKALAKTLGKIS